MTEEKSHRACVQGWMQASAGCSPERRAEAFDRAFAALWERAHRTVGNVTLAAIVDRVLHNATERFPVLASLKVEESSGLQCQGLRERTSLEGSASLEPAIEFMLVEFLQLLGSLTAEILTPALHKVLAAQATDQWTGTGIGAKGEPESSKRKDRKGSES